MARVYHKKNIHTCPELAGEHNMPEDYIEKNKVSDNNMTALAELFVLSGQMKEKRRGLNWTPEELQIEIQKYFNWSAENGIKPAISGLSLWIACGHDTLKTWASEPNKYGGVSEIARDAMRLIELQYVSRLEKYPTGNIFLLKTSHGHVETSKVDITSNGKEITNQENVEDLVSRLGLDKK